ncbi:MAG: polyprenyl synthetase family protein [Bacillota bacterium]|nr:polyprenyl synthetase family protein [Bacillota bacterium]
MRFRDHLDSSAGLVDGELRRLLSSQAGVPSPLAQAMEYAVFGGGKRLRPAMLLFVNSMYRGPDAAVVAAAAVELVHTYSLVHDDLPAMDDDAVRRGKPTVHVAFDEATAILAGDGLLTLAFEALASSVSEGVPGNVAAGLALELARAAGPGGMVGGQALDMGATSGTPAPTIERIHELKTARMFCASARMGAILGGAPREDLQALTDYALHFGALYQAADDLEDFAGQDGVRDKITYPVICGVEATSDRIALKATLALESLVPFDDRAWWLRDLVNYVKSR